MCFLKRAKINTNRQRSDKIGDWRRGIGDGERGKEVTDVCFYLHDEL